MSAPQPGASRDSHVQDKILHWYTTHPGTEAHAGDQAAVNMNVNRLSGLSAAARLALAGKLTKVPGRGMYRLAAAAAVAAPAEPVLERGHMLEVFGRTAQGRPTAVDEAGRTWVLHRL